MPSSSSSNAPTRRAEELRGRDGKAVWKVDVFDGSEDWAVLWHPNDSGLVVIAWIGLWPPSQ
jgi:hypothetical protein